MDERLGRQGRNGFGHITEGKCQCFLPVCARFRWAAGRLLGETDCEERDSQLVPERAGVANLREQEPSLEGGLHVGFWRSRQLLGMLLFRHVLPEMPPKSGTSFF